MKAKPVLDIAARQLADTTGTRWPQVNLADYLSWTLAEMAGLYPDSVAELDSIKLSDGAEQDVPSDVIRWLGGVRNMGTGSSPGRAVRNVDPNMLEAYDPDWINGKPDNVVRDVMFAASMPRKFYVYPPVTTKNGDVYLQVRVAKEPPDGSTIDNDPGGTDIPVTEDYFNVALNGVLAYALAEDTGDADAQLASQYSQAFYQALGMDRKSKARARPAAKEDEG